MPAFEKVATVDRRNESASTATKSVGKDHLANASDVVGA